MIVIWELVGGGAMYLSKHPGSAAGSLCRGLWSCQLAGMGFAGVDPAASQSVVCLQVVCTEGVCGRRGGGGRCLSYLCQDAAESRMAASCKRWENWHASGSLRKLVFCSLLDADAAAATTVAAAAATVDVLRRQCIHAMYAGVCLQLCHCGCWCAVCPLP